MTSRFLPHRLLPDAAWFYRRLKVYVWVALASACAAIFVAGWMAEGSSSENLLAHISSALSLIASVVAVFASWGGNFWSRDDKSSRRQRP
jgi:hypothetical protein